MTQDYKHIRRHGMPMAEIMQVTGLPATTIKTRIKARGLRPLGYISGLAFFAERDLPLIAADGLRGRKAQPPTH